MKNDAINLSKILINKKISDTKKLEIVGKYLRKYMKSSSNNFVMLKAIEWTRRLDDLLFMPTINIRDYENVDTNGLYLLEKDEILLEEVVEYLKESREAYYEARTYNCRYKSIFEDYAKYITPSHSKRGNLTHQQINDAKKERDKIKDKNKTLFEIIRKASTRFNTSLDLTIYCFSRLMKLELLDDGTYQLTFRQDELIYMIREYCKLTNQDYYSNEFDKASLIRSIANEVASYCFSEFNITLQGAFKMKYHSRLLLNMRISKNDLKDSKSYIFNFITFNKLTNKLVNYFHVIRKLKNHNKQVIIIEPISSGNTLNNTS